MPAENNGHIFRTGSFTFQMDGVQLETLKRVSGLQIRVEPVLVKTTNGQGQIKTQKYAGALTPPSITLVRGMAKSDKLTAWLKNAATDPANCEKVNASIVFTPADKGSDKITVNLVGAWVSSWTPGDLDVTNENPVDETFILECDEVKIS
ncbi:phage tail protein [Streptomyces sp. NPDC090442]|uniref:phage tail protein n=1 Tax=Streptomyces sp. NPDC090442 TaxID=3365962 RepID=UPI00381F413B